MAEEHRCQAPEGHRLCANNCGFFGSPATMNLCSKCYRDLHHDSSPSKSSIEIPVSSAYSPSSPPQSKSPSATEVLPAPPALTLPEAAVKVRKPAAEAGAPEVVTIAAQPNRCFMCRKRVGLTGFKCRCGTTFCGVHRYPEKHGCAFDFKAVGREEIARANPVVIAEKLERI
ncbi:Zinc finger A20 and AN1 domain-containing stress-associated protein 4 [Morella rubra]|uniref:Zinc finger A20 and AN1 domain-containing stress-associated protein 4 n=1 Tax=Morella rubra TaxID=262757 RepID=A0A6A1W8U7_9ROSI|nr:Zinc finger A20 and AN1 domain-containing stress-associated protein 4 [Morella rubra]